MDQKEFEPIEDRIRKIAREFISKLHHRDLTVGSHPHFTMSRTALVDYSILSKIPKEKKQELISLAITLPKFNRAIGAMVGMAVGDFVGAPLEFLPAVDKPRKHGKRWKHGKHGKQGTEQFDAESLEYKNGKSNTFGLEFGQWTDDASMGLCMADSLILKCAFDGSDIRIRFWNWWFSGYCNAFRVKNEGSRRLDRSSVGLGGNISKSLYSMRRDTEPSPAYEATTNDSGNGSIMRLAPIPVFCHSASEKQVLEMARLSSSTTHPGQIAAEACAFVAYLIVRAINLPDSERTNIKDFLDSSVVLYLKILTERSASPNSEETSSSSNPDASEEASSSSNPDAFEEASSSSNLDAFEEASSSGNPDASTPGHADASNGVHAPVPDEQSERSHHEEISSGISEMIALLESNEANDSRERNWNWKSDTLDIEGTLRRRGRSYNGYPVSAGYFGSYCIDGLAMALFAVYHTNSFDAAIERCVNFLGDADSTGSVAGQIAGAYYGYSTLDKRLIEVLRRWDESDFTIKAILLVVLGDEVSRQPQAVPSMDDGMRDSDDGVESNDNDNT